MKPPLEKAEQQWGVALLRSLGADVWVTGVPRRKGDYQGAMRTPGLPDVLAFLPAREPGGARCLLCWEVKRHGRSTLRPEQHRFRQCVQLVAAPQSVASVVGSYNILLLWLMAGGWVREQSLPHYRVGRREKSRPDAPETT